MKLIPGNASTAISLTDSATDTTVDQAAFYASAASLTNCNAASSTAITIGGVDQGGVSIQLIGTNGTSILTKIPGATGVGAPTTSYGSFKFTTTVNP
jgi:hypothetical protein